MNKKVLRLEIFGFIFTCAIGTLMHFVFEWSGNNPIVGLFCPVNESVFEHLKMLFFPYLIWTFIEVAKLSQDKFNVYTAKLIGTTSSMLTTLSVFYIYLGMFGRYLEAISISSFYIGMLIGFLISYKIITFSKGKGLINGISFAMLIIIAIIFIFFTLFPANIPFFTP